MSSVSTILSSSLVSAPMSTFGTPSIQPRSPALPSTDSDGEPDTPMPSVTSQPQPAPATDLERDLELERPRPNPRACLYKVLSCCGLLNAASSCITDLFGMEEEETLIPVPKSRFQPVQNWTPEPLTPLRPKNAIIPFEMPGSPTPRRKLLLPPQQAQDAGKLCIVFDLDETLVQNRLGPGLMVERPYLRQLLDALKGKAEVVLWTASTDIVGGAVVNAIDREGYFNHCIYRSDTWFQDVDGPYTKDLTLLGRDMSRTVIVENTPKSVRMNPENAVMVADFWGDKRNDSELEGVCRVLEEMIAKPDTSVPELIEKSPHMCKRRSRDVKGGSLRYIA